MPLSGKMHSYLLYSTMIGGPIAEAVLGALALLSGETEGFSIDATTYDSITAASYVGGPVGGTVAVRDTGTPANDLSNVALDSSNLVQSGTSPKTVHFPSSPYVRWTPHNLILQSQDIATTWTNNNSTETTNATTAPDGTATADQLTQDTATTNCYITQSFTAVSGLVYCFSAYLKANGTATDWARIYLTDGTDSAGRYFDLTNGTGGSTTASGWGVLASGIESVGSGWYRCYVATTVDNTTVSVRVELAEADNDSDVQSGDDVFVWGLQVNRGPIPTPYIATTSAAVIGIPLGYDSAQSQYGILCEPAATNLWASSEAFATTWSVGEVTFSSNSTTAPDGSTTADTIIPSTNSAVHSISQSVSTTSGGAYTQSVYAKAAGYNYLRVAGSIAQFPDAERAAIFNLSSGTVEAVDSNVTAEMLDVGDGWYRCSVAMTADATTSNSPAFAFINAWTSGTGNVTFAGNGTSGIYLWGAQFEAGSVATSYIPTAAATVTRAADNIIALTSTFDYGSANTAYADVKTRLVTAQHDFLAFDANNSDENESVFLYTDSSANILMRIEDGGSAQLGPLDSGQNASANTRFQVSGAWATNDVDVSAEGQAAVSDGTATMPTVTHIRLGNNPTPGNHLNGFIYRIVQVPRQVETDEGDIETWRYEA